MNEIIMTRIFPNSEYLQEGNIGHEIINLFKADNNRNYIYIMPGGDYAYKHKDNNIEAVLIVRGINANCVEVIARATGLTAIFNPTENWKSATEADFREMGKLVVEKGINNITESDKYEAKYKSGKKKEKGETHEIIIGKKILNFNKEHEKQIDYIKLHDIRYGGVLLNELFANNTTDKYGLSIYITFEAESIKKAKEPFYLYIGEDTNKITDNDCQLLERARLSGSALTTYYLEGSKDYENIKKNIINNDKLWGDEISKYEHPKTEENDFTFLNIIKKEYDELSFSNMFAYYFDKYPKLLEYFLNNIKTENDQNILNKSFSLKNKPEICREENDVDILIKANSIIIIENKIKSAINGQKHDIHGELIGTQLNKYYDYVVDTYNEEPVCLIFSPDYNKINKEQIKNNMGEKYKIIKYSKIYEVVNDFYLQNRQIFAADKYFTDFLKAIKYHSVDNDNRFEEISKRKLKSLIEKAK